MHKRLGGFPDTAWVGGFREKEGGPGRVEGIKEKGRFSSTKGHMILLEGQTSCSEEL